MGPLTFNVSFEMSQKVFVGMIMNIYGAGLQTQTQSGTKAVTKRHWYDYVVLCVCLQVRSHMEAEWQMPGTSAASGPSSKAFSHLQHWNLITPTPAQVLFNFQLSSIQGKAKTTGTLLIKFSTVNVCASLWMHTYIFFVLTISPPCVRHLLRSRSRQTRAV